MAVLALTLVGDGGSAAALELESYLEAAKSGVAGEVAGRAYEERRRPELAERPLQGATVTLLPQPGILTRRLDDIKQGARDSDHDFRAAVPRMLEAQHAHERAVRGAGGADLVLGTSTGPEGTFTVPGVPAGAWILIVRDENVVPGRASQHTRQDRQMFRLGPTLEGYRSVRLWVRHLTVLGGRVEAVELSDRNVWFSGVMEIRSGGRR